MPKGIAPTKDRRIAGFSWLPFRNRFEAEASAS